MKPDSERKKYFSAKMHQKKKNLHIHLSKDLRKTMKQKKRAIGVRKGDMVKIMRGQHAGKNAKVTQVSIADRCVFLEGFTRKTARGKEIPVPFQASNLQLISLLESKERSAVFGAGVFMQKENAKKQKKEKSAVALSSATDSGEKPAGVEEELSKTATAE